MAPTSPRTSRFDSVLLVGLGALIVLAVAGAVVWAMSRTGEPTAATATPGATTATPAESQAPRTAYELVDESDCPDSDFTCVTLRVPLDHFAPAGGPTIEVTFGLLRASGNARGTFVTVTGGPGTSGLAVADSYTSVFDPAITDRYDVVFLDQRGVGRSAPLQCPKAVLEWYTTTAVPTLSDDEAAAYAGAAGAFSADCVDELGVQPETLSGYATRQAVEDLEAFRSWLGEDQMHMYGESYGSQFVQAYASAHPDRVAALMLDGPVDLTLEPFDYYAEQVAAFDETLVHTMEACADDDLCARNVLGEHPLAAWDVLASRLAEGPMTFDFVTATGEIEQRTFGLGDLETGTAGYLYSTTDQMLLQRAIAYASRGELLPLARLTYISLGQDPETLDTIPDPTYSDAMYYAVECMDYAFSSGDTDASEAAYLAAGEAAGVADIRLGSIFYGDLPCVSWPVSASTADRPDYLADAPFPIIVLASTPDPATPYAGAERLYEQARDGYLITQPGGAHIIFGRGNPCPDDLVTAILVDGTLPEDRETACEPMSPDSFVALPPARLTDAVTPMDAMLAADDEINYNPDYWNWGGVEPLAFGCLHGGSIAYEPTDVGYDVALDGCAFTDDLPLTGTAVIDDEAGTFSLIVSGPGRTRLEYLRDAEGGVSVSGRWMGEPAR